MRRGLLYSLRESFNRDAFVREFAIPASRLSARFHQRGSSTLYWEEKAKRRGELTACYRDDGVGDAKSL